MMRGHGVRNALGALVAIAALAAVVPLAQGGSRAVRVTGESVATADPAVSTMTGSLSGSWTTTEFDYTYDGATGAVVGWGAESFQGCLDKRRDGECGAGDPGGIHDLPVRLLGPGGPGHGRLDHRSLHPPGDGWRRRLLAHASGVIEMRDTPQSDGSVVTTYRGKLVMQPAATASRRTPAARRGARTAAQTAPSFAAAC